MVRNKRMDTCSFVLLLFLAVKPQVNYFSAKSVRGIWMTFWKENVFVLHQTVEKAIPLMVSAAEEESRSKVLHHLTHLTVWNPPLLTHCTEPRATAANTRSSCSHFRKHRVCCIDTLYLPHCMLPPPQWVSPESAMLLHLFLFSVSLFQRWWHLMWCWCPTHPSGSAVMSSSMRCCSMMAMGESVQPKQGRLSAIRAFGTIVNFPHHGLLHYQPWCLQMEIESKGKKTWKEWEGIRCFCTEWHASSAGIILFIFKLCMPL